MASYDTDYFPAFYSPSSGLRAPARVDTPGEAAALLRASRRLGLASGAVIAVPIPAEVAARVGAEAIQMAVDAAVAEATARGVAGAALTPFLLRRVNEATGGRALEANIALVKNNARVGAAIAVALAGLERAEKACVIHGSI